MHAHEEWGLVGRKRRTLYTAQCARRAVNRQRANAFKHADTESGTAVEQEPSAGIQTQHPRATDGRAGKAEASHRERARLSRNPGSRVDGENINRVSGKVGDIQELGSGIHGDLWND